MRRAARRPTGEELMRYRRVSYRYALLVTPNQDQAFGGPLVAAQPRFAETFWRPPSDVCESATTIVVTVDLAGIDQDDLDVVLFEDALIVEGRRRLAADPGVGHHPGGIPQGALQIAPGVPGAIDQDRVDARYDKGLL